ncbi:MAG: hypothetical protein M3123_03450, partial [Actinomycetota bacterium]|nr:hypothetical protein [Actinomycetota bacterium]
PRDPVGLPRALVGLVRPLARERGGRGVLWYVASVSDAPVSDRGYEVTCPHCRKHFTAQLMAGAAARHRGFKCPHCKLFVPLSRASEASSR